jgi:ABC-type lipoprotein export system ATPase subunit
MTLLSAQGLSLNRGKTPVLHFPDLSLDPGERLLLLGPSGSGKTSLLSILAGILEPTSGQVLLRDQDLHAGSARSRDALRGRNFGFIFQTLHLLPHLDLRQNVLLPAQVNGVGIEPDRADVLLSSLGLRDKATRRPAELSQGEQQRAAVARAIHHRPAIVLADEPTSALDDVNAAKAIETILAQTASNGAALIVATHDMRLVRYFENRIELTEAA